MKTFLISNGKKFYSVSAETKESAWNILSSIYKNLIRTDYTVILIAD